MKICFSPLPIIFFGLCCQSFVTASTVHFLLFFRSLIDFGIDGKGRVVVIKVGCMDVDQELLS